MYTIGSFGLIEFPDALPINNALNKYKIFRELHSLKSIFVKIIWYQKWWKVHFFIGFSNFEVATCKQAWSRILNTDEKSSAFESKRAFIVLNRAIKLKFVKNEYRFVSSWTALSYFFLHFLRSPHTVSSILWRNHMRNSFCMCFEHHSLVRLQCTIYNSDIQDLNSNISPKTIFRLQEYHVSWKRCRIKAKHFRNRSFESSLRAVAQLLPLLMHGIV